MSTDLDPRLPILRGALDDLRAAGEKLDQQHKWGSIQTEDQVICANRFKVLLVSTYAIGAILETMLEEQGVQLVPPGSTERERRQKACECIEDIVPGSGVAIEPWGNRPTSPPVEEEAHTH